MNLKDFPRLRLYNQQIAASRFRSAHDLVSYMGAVQAQDFLMSLWAVGLRLRSATEASIEKSISEGQIIRTWPMRGTIHYVASTDAKWILKLTAQRINAGMKNRLYREFNISDDVLAKSRKIFIKSLRGGRIITRKNLHEILDKEGISPKKMRGIHIMWHLAQEGLICFGPREGKQPTFVLLDEWVKKSKDLMGDEALSEMAKRYFISHGPATLQDFTWWTGLKVAEAKRAIELAKSNFEEEDVEGKTYWFPKTLVIPKNLPEETYLLPAFDEYLVAYKDRTAVLDLAHTLHYNAGGGMLNPVIVVKGRVVGTWRRTLKRGVVSVTPLHFNSRQKHDLRKAVDRYSAFLTSDSD